MPALHSPPASALRRRPRLLRSVETDESDGEIAFKSLPSAGRRNPARPRRAAHAPRRRVRRGRPSRLPRPRKVTAKPVVKPPPRRSQSLTAKSAAKKGQWVYAFGGGKAEGRAEMRNLLGGKGAGLAEMAHLGLPVPPGFTITTEVCTYFYEHDKTYPKDLKPQVEAALAQVGRITGKNFGDSDNPLLVSVRSGARASMPGMMDTVLNLGLNDITVAALAEKSGDRRFAYDSYRRFITMYSDVVLGIPHHHFEEILDEHKDRNGYTLDTDLEAGDWEEIVGAFKARVEKESGRPFPQDAHAQLWGAIGAVFSSWMNQRAITYRRLHAIPESWGTAVNVQAMVFGNMGDTSATGVAFTRNPSTGEKKLYGEFLINAQGEDVVAGIRTPQEITEEARNEAGSNKPSMESAMPAAFAELKRIHGVLEKHYRDMQDLEFTVEQGKLWMLQTRNGKRTAKAALRIAVELAQEKLISKDEAVDAHRSGLARPIAASDHRSRRRAQDHRHRPAGVARRRLRRDRVLVRGRGASQKPGPQGRAGARRDLAGGHSRHACGGRHPHHARRHDLACGRGGARHGQALRRRRRRPARRLSRADHDRRRRHDEEGRHHHHRRLDRAGAGRQGGDARAGACRRIRHADEMGRRGAQAESARQCRHAGGRARRHEIRRRRHRAVPHRAYVLRGGSHPRGARDDPRRRREGAARGAGEAAADAARRLCRIVRHHGRPAGDHPAPRSAAARIPSAHRARDRRSGPGHGRRRAKARRPRARAARVQSDARLPRLPACHRLSGNRRDAGARDFRSRGRGRAHQRQAGRCRKSWCR